MSAPLLSEPPRGVVLHALPAYEPTHEPGEPGPPPRWSSLRPVRGPQLALVAPPRRPDAPVTRKALWRLLIHLLEVLDGRRTVGQLRTVLAAPAYEALLTRLRTMPPGRQHRLRRLRTCYPTCDAVEISAVVDVTTAASGRPRTKAIAMRLDHVGDRWQCGALRIL